MQSHYSDSERTNIVVACIQGSKVGGTYGPRSLPVNHRMTRSMDSCISNECFEEEAPPTGHFTPRNSLDEVAEVDCSSQGSQGNSAQSVSLEFEGTERLRDLDGGMLLVLYYRLTASDYHIA